MKQLILLFALAAMFSGCKKSTYTEPGQATFYTLENENFNLIVDGVEMGRIKKATQMPVCGDRVFQVLKLSAGEHVVDAKSTDGYAWGHPKTITVPEGGCLTVQLP
jgi:hypothetical protein